MKDDWKVYTKPAKTFSLWKIFFLFILLLVLAGGGIYLYWDRTPPVLSAEDQKIEYGKVLSISDIVKASDDRSKDVSLTITSITPQGAVIQEDALSVSFPEPGSYTVTVSGRDDFKNESTVSFLVEVVDSVAPEFTYTADSYTVAYGQEISLVNSDTAATDYVPTEQSDTESSDSQSKASDTSGSQSSVSEMNRIVVTASDEMSESISLSIISVKPLQQQNADSYTLKDGKVTFHKLGSYQLELQAEDAGANVATTTVTVKVVDKTPPEFTKTEENYELAYGKKIQVIQTDVAKDTTNLIYVTAKDDLSNLTLDITSATPKEGQSEDSCTIEDGSLILHTIGKYEVTIRATDEAGNEASQAVTVTAVDKTAPSLDGVQESVTLSDQDTSYDWAEGVSASDEIDGDLTDSIKIDSDSVSYGESGSYTVTYSVTDAAGNKTKEVLPVRIKDSTPPELSVPDSFTMTVGDEEPDYMEGVTATDSSGDDVRVSVDSTEVDSMTAGSYTIYYTAKDKSGNSSTAESTVIVEEDPYLLFQ